MDNGAGCILHTSEVVQKPGADSPSLWKVETVIKKLNQNRSAGPDGINAELLKVKEPELIKAIHVIVCIVWTTEQMLIEWDEGSVCPIFKKGIRQDCCNYTGIILLNSIFKIFSNILYNRLPPHVEKVIGSY